MMKKRVYCNLCDKDEARKIAIVNGFDHGTACGILLPYFVDYIDFKDLPKLFNLCSTKEVVTLLKQSFVPPKIKNFNADLIIDKVMKYNKINDVPKRIDRKCLTKILEKSSQIDRSINEIVNL